MAFFRLGAKCPFAHGRDELQTVTAQLDPTFLHRSLVRNVRNVQMSRPAHKDRWHEHCDTHFGGTRDPSWRSSEELRGFLLSLVKRPVVCEYDESFHASLVDRVKVARDSSADGAAQWAKHC